MIDFLINLLQKIKESNRDLSSQSSSPSKYVAVMYYIFLLFFIGLISPLVYLLIEVDFSDLAQLGFGNNMFLLILLCLFFISFYSFLYQRRAFLSWVLNIWQAIYTVYFPWLLTLIFILSLSSLGWWFLGDLNDEVWRLQLFWLVSNNLISLILILIYPLLWMIGNRFFSVTLKPLYQKLISIFSWYTIWYLLVLSMLILRRMIVDSWEVIGTLDRWLIYFLLTLFFVTFPLVSLRYYLLLRNKKWVLFYTILFLWVTVVFTFADSVLSQIVSYPVRRSVRIIEKWGDNYDTYKKAQTLFLSQSYLAGYKRWSYSNQTFFNKLYDAVPESYFWEKLGDTSLNNSRGTNASKIWKNADVTLKLAEIESQVLSSPDEIDVLQTVYKFHMVNKVETNQEVIIQFQTPSQNSVVTDLKLWLNWELIGIIAPRGAANKVYEDSLRINRDPALLEKMGLNTYRLRVFPIPSKLDQKTQWRQLVQFTVLSPLEKWKTIVYSPQLSLINLQINKETSLISKIYKQEELVHEDRVENTSIDQYLATDHILSWSFMDSISSVPLSDYCIPKIQNSAPIISFDKIGILWNVIPDSWDDPNSFVLESIPLNWPSESYHINEFRGYLLCEKENIWLRGYENWWYSYPTKNFKFTQRKFPNGYEVLSYFFADEICEEEFWLWWKFSRYYAKDLSFDNTENWQKKTLKILDSWITNLDHYSTVPVFVGIVDPENIPDILEIDNNYLFYPLQNNEKRFALFGGNKSSSLQNQNQKWLSSNQKPKTKTSIFFDNSLSVKRNTISSFYAPLYNAIKNYNNKIQDVDIFSFNFFVEKQVSLKDLKFWWYSDIDGLLDYIEKDNIKNQRIIIVTDDDNFNFTTTENTNRDFSKILTNEIHVIVLWKGVKTYKSDFMSLLAASRGTIHTVKNEDQFNNVLVDIFKMPVAPLEECGSWTILSKKNESKSPEVQKILAWIWTTSLMSSAQSSTDWNAIAQQQTLFAKKYNIVNQFNSMIALETEQQMRDLEKYQQQNDKYNSSYQNWWNARSSSSKLSFSNFLKAWSNVQMDASIPPMLETNIMPWIVTSSDIFFGESTVSNSTNSFGASPSFGVTAGKSFSSESSRYYWAGYDSSRDINVSLWIILCILLLYGVQIYQVYLLVILLYWIYKKSWSTSLDPSPNWSTTDPVDITSSNISVESLLSWNQEIPKTK
jgi:hypothetical protein